MIEKTLIVLTALQNIAYFIAATIFAAAALRETGITPDADWRTGFTVVAAILLLSLLARKDAP